MPLACPIGRRIAGNHGEPWRTAHIYQGQHPYSSGVARVRDLPNWCSRVQPARPGWTLETPPTARSTGDVAVQRRTRMLEELSNTLVQLLELLREL